MSFNGTVVNVQMYWRLASKEIIDNPYYYGKMVLALLTCTLALLVASIKSVPLNWRFRLRTHSPNNIEIIGSNIHEIPTRYDGIADKEEDDGQQTDVDHSQADTIFMKDILTIISSKSYAKGRGHVVDRDSIPEISDGAGGESEEQNKLDKNWMEMLTVMT